MSKNQLIVQLPMSDASDFAAYSEDVGPSFRLMPAIDSGVCRPGRQEWRDCDGCQELASTCGDSVALLLAHGGTVQHESVAVMHESIQDRVGKRWSIDVGMPAIEGYLRRDQR
jgi:hypothetical protein